MTTSTKSFSARLIIVVFLSLILLSVYFIVSSYVNFIKNSEDAILAKLSAISSTIALNFDGELHRKLIKLYDKKDEIKTNDQNRTYQTLHQVLSDIQKQSKINSPIYTLVWNEEKETFFFGITSAENPYYRHSYESFPPELRDNYNTGGVIHVYGDDHGKWLSAFHPFMDADGNVAGVIQVDETFDNFIDIARAELRKNIAISGSVLLLIGVVLFFFIRKIIANEEAAKEAMQRYLVTIEEKNRDITESINYASKIQQAIIPDFEEIAEHLNEAFVIYKPKDIVSGDFYWFNKLSIVADDGSENGDRVRVLIGTVDCTGHGVPGAMMAVIGHSLLDKIVKEEKITEPASILDNLNKGIIHTLKQNEENSYMNDGMDVALCSVDVTKKEVQFSAAYRPLFWVRDGKLQELKGDKFPVGGSQFARDRKFTNHKIEVGKGDCIYLFTDGYCDQFGGPNNKKFMAKRLIDALESNHKKPMDEQKDVLERMFEDWKGEYEQIDDVAFIGIKF